MNSGQLRDGVKAMFAHHWNEMLATQRFDMAKEAGMDTSNIRPFPGSSTNITNTHNEAPVWKTLLTAGVLAAATIGTFGAGGLLIPIAANSLQKPVVNPRPRPNTPHSGNKSYTDTNTQYELKVLPPE